MIRPRIPFAEPLCTVACLLVGASAGVSVLARGDASSEMSRASTVLAAVIEGATATLAPVIEGASATLARGLEPAQGDHRKFLRDYGLTLTLPPQLTDLTENVLASGQVKGDWSGRLGGAKVRIVLYVLPGRDFELSEPEDVCDLVLGNLREPEGGDPSFAFEEMRLVSGSFGFAGHAAIGRGAIHKPSGHESSSSAPSGTERAEVEIAGTIFVLGELLKDGGYAIQVRAEPALSERDARPIVDFLEKGVAYRGDERNCAWTDEEANARWMRDAPDSAKKKLEPILRTEHYLLMTDSPGRRDFGEKMEQFYSEIRRTYPFEEIATHKLMPVFLFRSVDEYYDFCSRMRDMPRDDALRSRGHASHDYYATWFTGANEPVHVHEATHQIFTNRLHLRGGGSWFQEGLAEYMSTNSNVRGIAARAVRAGKHMPLAEFVLVKSLLFTFRPDNAPGERPMDPYLEAAFFIEFLHESEWTKDKFQNIVHALGDVPANDVAAIQRAFRGVYDTDLAGIEAQWVEYAKNRR
jgi:hypothetical protein